MTTNSLIGRVINGRYEIRALLGRGGMASVYRAHDRSLDREVALKILYPQFTADPANVERFKQEAITAARLDHPNIVPVYDVGQQADLIYIAMKLLRGQSLQELLDGGQTLTLRHTLAVADGVAQALDYAHGRGVVHRDIKPGNIFIERPVAGDGSPGAPRAMLTDFGIAKILDTPGTTRTGIMVGTPDYMAPEQIRGVAVDARADVYALGLVVYRALTGQLPFRGDTQAVLMAQLSQRPAPPSTVNSNVPAALDGVVLRALAKQPAERYPRAGGFVAALVEAQRNPQAAPLPPSQQPTVASSAIRPASPQAPTTVVPPLSSRQPAPRAERVEMAPARTAGAAPPAHDASRSRWLYGGLLAVIAALLAALLFTVSTLGQSNGLIGLPTSAPFVPATPTLPPALPTETPTSEPTPEPSPEPTDPAVGEPTVETPTALPPSPTPVIIVVTPTSPPLPPTATPTDLPPTATPTPTAPPPTATPTAEPATITPTPDPAAACADPSLLTGGFGALWREQPELQQALGCPDAALVGMPAVRRDFERGLMLWLGEPERIIFTFESERGRWDSYNDTYEEGEQLPDEDAPPGLFVPDRGFGKLWRLEPRVRADLGFSTEPNEQGPAEGAQQLFQKGRMLYIDDPQRGKLIYVLRDAGKQFAVFQDPTGP
jgi:serine/threonine-protein kinase